MIKYSIHQEDITIVHIDMPNKRVPLCIKETLIYKEIDIYTIIIGDFKTPLTWTDRLPIQKTNKEAVALSHTLGQIDLTDIYRILYLRKTDMHTFQVHMEHFPG